jgi:hypothetical protein
VTRGGYSVPELLVALALSGLVTALAAGLLRSQSIVARNIAERARRAEALRAAAHILTTELRWLAASDLRTMQADSLALRAFRGSGVVCAAESDAVTIRYRGVRQPDVTKDSLVVLRDTIFEAVMPLNSTAATTEGCTHGADEQLLRIANVALRPGDAVAYFESGSYYLTSSALRYRLGAEGRQPITAELFDDRDTRFGALIGGFGQAILSTRLLPGMPRARSVVRLVPGASLPQ